MQIYEHLDSKKSLISDMPSQDLEISQFSETIDYNEHSHNAGTKSIKMKTFPHV